MRTEFFRIEQNDGRPGGPNWHQVAGFIEGRRDNFWLLRAGVVNEKQWVVRIDSKDDAMTDCLDLLREVLGGVYEVEAVTSEMVMTMLRPGVTYSYTQAMRIAPIFDDRWLTASSPAK